MLLMLLLLLARKEERVILLQLLVLPAALEEEEKVKDNNNNKVHRYDYIIIITIYIIKIIFSCQENTYAGIIWCPKRVQNGTFYVIFAILTNIEVTYYIPNAHFLNSPMIKYTQHDPRYCFYEYLTLENHDKGHKRTKSISFDFPIHFPRISHIKTRWRRGDQTVIFLFEFFSTLF